MAKKDYYEVLGVPKTATDAEIKSALRKLAKNTIQMLTKPKMPQKNLKKLARLILF